MNHQQLQIERDAIKARVLDSYQGHSYGQIVADVMTLLVENDNLRKVLMHIADYDTGLRDGDWQDILNIQEEARKALGEGGSR